MDDHGAFTDAATALMGPGNASMCEPFVSALPVTRVAISVLQAPFAIETVCASDDRAARFDELQIDLGEGPSWQVATSRSPVLVPDFRSASASWPTLSEAVGGDAPGSVFAIPLAVGTLGMGSVGLYCDVPGDLEESHLGRAVVLAALASRQVLRRAMAAMAAPDDPDLDGKFSRREVHQATGMVAAQLRIDVDDALVVIRGNAFALGIPVRQLASDIVANRRDLSRD